MESNKNDIKKLKELLNESEAIVIGAGAGLSTAAGFTYEGERFRKYFFDFIRKYSLTDMYSAAFYKYKTKEEFWAFFSRLIYVNRYVDIPKDSYSKLFQLVKNLNYFVITTNCDHCFQKAGFSKNYLFYTQGDYGCFQCGKPCHQKVYDNKNIIEKMILSQRFEIDEKTHDLIINDHNKIKSVIDSYLIPKCPDCGEFMTYHLRGDDKFVEDQGWHNASKNYAKFLENNKKKKVLFLEIGVGFNTPGIIKYPFIKNTLYYPDAFYCCINKGEGFIPEGLEKKSLIFNEDVNIILNELLN